MSALFCLLLLIVVGATFAVLLVAGGAKLRDKDEGEWK